MNKHRASRRRLLAVVLLFLVALLSALWLWRPAADARAEGNAPAKGDAKAGEPAGERANENAAEKKEARAPVNPLTSHSRARHVHRIELLDAEGKGINPTDPDAPPYSPARTCGKCHEVAAINHGWHFNAPATGLDPEVHAGRPGEPWVVADNKDGTGTQIPVSSRGWPGTYKPEAIGLKDYEFVRAFGHHLPGGGMGDLTRLFDAASYAEVPERFKDPKGKWEQTGALEIDCMVCHAASNVHDPAEYGPIINHLDFKYEPTEALDLGKKDTRPRPKKKVSLTGGGEATASVLSPALAATTATTTTSTTKTTGTTVPAATATMPAAGAATTLGATAPATTPATSHVVTVRDGSAEATRAEKPAENLKKIEVELSRAATAPASVPTTGVATTTAPAPVRTTTAPATTLAATTTPASRPVAATTAVAATAPARVAPPTSAPTRAPTTLAARPTTAPATTARATTIATTTAPAPVTTTRATTIAAATAPATVATSVVTKPAATAPTRVATAATTTTRPSVAATTRPANPSTTVAATSARSTLTPPATVGKSTTTPPPVAPPTPVTPRTPASPVAAKPPSAPVAYDEARFTKDVGQDTYRVFLDITRDPPVERCYFCHSQHEVGPDAPSRWHTDADVHIRAGMTCSECHRNDIHHRVTRNFENEERPEAPTVTAGALTCRGCHYGDADSHSTPNQLGRLGAPRPEHRGLPPLHFQKLSCTACHSGPWPEEQPRTLQTSLGHGLGMSKRESDWTRVQLPYVSGPIFLTEPNDGRIAPHRLMYPAFWGRMKDGQITPLLPDAVKSPVNRGRDKAKPAADGGFSDEQIFAILEAMSKQTIKAGDPTGEPIYVGQGHVYQRGEGGKLAEPSTPGAAAAARPYAWPIAHDVRPAAQALGVRGCTDCHSSGGAIYFGKVVSPLEKRAAMFPVKTQIELRHSRGEGGQSVALASAWAWSFGYRPAFKALALVATILLALVLLRYALGALSALSRRFGGK